MTRHSTPESDHATAALINSRMGATQPVLCILAVLLSGLTACSLVPDSLWYVPGALRLSGIVMSLGLLFGVFLAAVRSPLALFRAELILLAGLIYWLVLDSIQSRYALEVDRDVVVQMFACITLFAVCFWAGAAIASRLRYPVPRAEPASAELTISFVFWAAVGCALLGMSYKVMSCDVQISCLYDNLMSSRRAAWILDYSWGPLRRLRPAGLMTLPLTVVLLIMERRLSFRGVLLLLLATTNVLLLLSDGRRVVGTTLGASVLIYVLLRPRITARNLMALAAGAALILLVLEAMASWRTVGFGQALEFNKSIENSGVIAVDKNFFHGTRAMSLVPSRHEHTSWLGVAYKAAFLVPQSLWRRPAKFGFDYAQLTGREGNPRWTATYSIIGDLWIIGGYTAMALGGLFWGALANMTSHLLLLPVSARNRLLYSAVVLALFVSLRATHELVATGLAPAALLGLYKLNDYLRTSATQRLGQGYAAARPRRDSL